MSKTSTLQKLVTDNRIYLKGTLNPKRRRMIKSNYRILTIKGFYSEKHVVQRKILGIWTEIYKTNDFTKAKYYLKRMNDE